LLFRLFEGYPADRLFIAEDIAGGRKIQGRPLPGVKIIGYKHANERRLKSRLTYPFGSWYFLRAAAAARKLEAEARNLGIEAVIGLAHGYGWITAESLARRLGVPFHLIVHDDWRATLRVYKWLEPRAEESFKGVYHRAISRLAISPAVEEAYSREFGPRATIFYPIRSRSLLNWTDARLVRKAAGPFTFAYAGNTSAAWVLRMLATFATVLSEHGARLRVHGDLDLEELRKRGLKDSNVDVVPFEADPRILQAGIIGGADAMYLPMGFDKEDRVNNERCFPSKLSDYTATGLPILIQAPEYASAQRWCRENQGAAYPVLGESPAEISAAVSRIIMDAGFRSALATKGAEAGNADFSHERLFEKFCNIVSSGRS
jgi:glycosyltransferase involved in cell wall biosynthesis